MHHRGLRRFFAIYALGSWGWWTALAQATPITTGGTGTIPAEASAVYGAWDGILVGGVLPIAVLGAGIITIVASIGARNSGGLIAGVVVAILGVIGAMALPGLITAQGTGAAALTPSLHAGFSYDPIPFLIWGGLSYARRRRRLRVVG